MQRRRLLSALGGSALAAACAPRLPTRSPEPARIGAIAFDLFTLVDPRGVDRRVSSVLGETPLAATWKTRLFEYCWLRAAAERYVDFEQLTHDALLFATRTHGVELTSSVRAKLVSAFTELEPWPDSVETLRELRGLGLRLAPLANYSPRMIDALLGNAGLRSSFDALISTDRARSYKPDPRAYALGEKVFGLARQQVAFAAFGNWDAAGAHWYGYPTFWVNRLNVSADELATEVATGPDLSALVAWVRSNS